MERAIRWVIPLFLYDSKTARLISGHDTTLRGAQVIGKQITAQVGNTLTIASLQDSSRYRSTDHRVSTSLNVGLSNGGGSATAGATQSDMDSDYAAVHDSSGLIAGDGGFNVHVQGATQLTGGQISSSRAAMAGQKNVLDSGTLNVRDIDNHARYTATSVGASMGLSSQGKGNDRHASPTQANANSDQSRASGISGWEMDHGVSHAIGVGRDGDDRHSTTHSGISTADITIGDRAAQARTGTSAADIIKQAQTDKDSQQLAADNAPLENHFDAARVGRTIHSEMQVMQAFDKSRQEFKKEQLDKANTAHTQAQALRRANGGEETAESRRLDSQYETEKARANTVDLVASVGFGAGSLGGVLTSVGLTQGDFYKEVRDSYNETDFQQCDPSGQNCTHREVDQAEIKPTDDGHIHLFNNGIFNDKEQALNTGARQHTDKENNLGVYYVLNPRSGGVVSEMIGAAYTKLNDVIGTHLRLTPAEKTNKEIMDKAQSSTIPVELICHSRGSNTCTNAMQFLNNANAQLSKENQLVYSITSVTFNGAASNAHKAANLVDALSNREGKMYQATHANDWVGRLIGWNPTSQPSSGFWPLMEQHNSYFGFEPQPGTLIGGVDSRALSDKYWGAGQHSERVLVLPDRLRHPSGK